MNEFCVCGIKNLLEKNKFFLESRKDTNRIIEKRVLFFNENDIFNSLRIMEHYAGGKIALVEIDDTSCLQKLVSKLKRPNDDKEKDERIKKMGMTIADLNKKLIELSKK